jgi:hypothetical protein
MRINSSLSLSFLFLVLFFSSCALTAMGGESDSEVREKCLSSLGKKYGKEYFQVNRKLYTDAEKNERAGDTPAALLLYRKIIGRDRPYRFREYIISESAYVVQAAFRMGKIYEKRGDRKNALRYYTFLLKKMEYSEVPLKLARSAKEARKRIDILK